MTVHLPRPYVLAVALIALVGVGVGVSTSVARAQDTRPKQVVCVQVPQQPGRLDETYLANFMSEQIAAGRSRFETVTGLSTVLCAW